MIKEVNYWLVREEWEEFMHNFMILGLLSLLLVPLAKADERSRKAWGTTFSYRTAQSPDGILDRVTARYMLERYYQIVGGSGRPMTEVQRINYRQDISQFRGDIRTILKENRGDFSESSGILYRNVRKGFENSASLIKVSGRGNVAGAIVNLVQIGIGSGFDTYESFRNSSLNIESGKKLSQLRGINDLGEGVAILAELDPGVAEVADEIFLPLTKASIKDSPEVVYALNADIAEFKTVVEVSADLKSGRISGAQAKEKFVGLVGKAKKPKEKKTADNKPTEAAPEEKRLTKEERADLVNEIKQEAADQRLALSAGVELGYLLKMDPEFLRVVDKVGNASVMVKEISKLASVEGISGLAMGAGYLQAGMMVASLFGPKSPSADELILGQLAELRKEVAELRRLMLKNFQAMDEKISDLYSLSARNFETIGKDVKNIQRDLGRLQASMNQLDTALNRWQTDLVNAHYAEQMRDCLPKKYAFTEVPNVAKLRDQDYVNCQNVVLQRALLTGPRNSSDTTARMNPKYPFENSYRALGEYIQQNFGKNSVSPYLAARADSAEEFSVLLAQGQALPLPDTSVWNNGIVDYASLSARNDTLPSSYGLRLLRAVGKNLKLYLAELVGVAAGDTYTLDQNLIADMLNRYEDLSTRLLVDFSDELKGSVESRFHPAKGAGQKVEDGFKDFRYNLVNDGLCEKVVPTYVKGKRKFKGSYGELFDKVTEANEAEFQALAAFKVDVKERDFQFPAKKLAELNIPDLYKMAQLAGVGNFHVCISSLRMPFLTIHRVNKQVRAGSFRLPVHEKQISYEAEIGVKISFQTHAKEELGEKPREFVISNPLIKFKRRNVILKNPKKTLTNEFATLWNPTAKSRGRSGQERLGAAKPWDITEQFVDARARNRSVNLLHRLTQTALNGLVENKLENEKDRNERLSQGLADVAELHRTITQALYLGAYPLWKAQGDKPGLEAILLGEERIPSPADLRTLVTKGRVDKKDIEAIRARFVETKKKFNALAEKTYVPAHPEVDMNLLLLDLLEPKK